MDRRDLLRRASVPAFFESDSDSSAYGSDDAAVMHAQTTTAPSKHTAPPSPSGGSFNCPDCNKSFTRAFTLRVHQRSHTGEKPYACEVCAKSFSRRFTLRRHLMTHSGEKPFACRHCPATFNQSSHLVRHERTHTPSGGAAGSKSSKRRRQSAPAVVASPSLSQQNAAQRRTQRASSSPYSSRPSPTALMAALNAAAAAAPSPPPPASPPTRFFQRQGSLEEEAAADSGFGGHSPCPSPCYSPAADPVAIRDDHSRNQSLNPSCGNALAPSFAQRLCFDPPSPPPAADALEAQPTAAVDNTLDHDALELASILDGIANSLHDPFGTYGAFGTTHANDAALVAPCF